MILSGFSLRASMAKSAVPVAMSRMYLGWAGLSSAMARLRQYTSMPRLSSRFRKSYLGEMLSNIVATCSRLPSGWSLYGNTVFWSVMGVLSGLEMTGMQIRTTGGIVCFKNAKPVGNRCQATSQRNCSGNPFGVAGDQPLRVPTAVAGNITGCVVGQKGLAVAAAVAGIQPGLCNVMQRAGNDFGKDGQPRTHLFGRVKKDAYLTGGLQIYFPHLPQMLHMVLPDFAEQFLVGHSLRKTSRFIFPSSMMQTGDPSSHRSTFGLFSVSQLKKR